MAIGSPFHAGEQSVQQQVGVRDEAEGLGQSMIRDFMPDQHRMFFSSLPFLYLAVEDAETRLPWATVAFTMRNAEAFSFRSFMDSPEPQVLLLRDAAVLSQERLALKQGDLFGAMGLMAESRRRNRMNGEIIQASGGESGSISFAARVQQSFGNCPKYIQAREVKVDVGAWRARSHGPVTEGKALKDARAREMVERADTFFIASKAGAAPGDSNASSLGLDMSHRGGNPGFVELSKGGDSLVWPDYRGNNMFQTLGNLMSNRHCGLLFLDYASGDALQLQGFAKLDLADASLPGGLRSVRFYIDRYVFTPGGTPLFARGPMELSPYNPLPSTADAPRRNIVEMRSEATDIKTFVFPLPSSGPVPKPGQFASFDFQLADGRALNRTWTVSSSAHEMKRTGRFSITVKRVGVISSCLHQDAQVGDQLIFRGFDGEFVPAVEDVGLRDIVLVAGGIGITPLRAMLPHFVAEGAGRRVTLLYAVRSLQEAAFLGEFLRLAKGGAMRLLLAISKGCPPDVPETVIPQECVWNGRLCQAMLRKQFPEGFDSSTAVYLCGPSSFMDSVSQWLSESGLPAANLRSEKFNF